MWTKMRSCLGREARRACELSCSSSAIWPGSGELSCVGLTEAPAFNHDVYSGTILDLVPAH